MIKNLVVVVSGGALAFGLAGALSPAMASASVAHPAGVTRAALPMPDGTPIIRDSAARLGDPDDGGQVTQAAARFGDPDDGGQVQVFAALSDPDDGGQ